ncbi:MAG TPA: hypothetical protein VGI45_20385 [Terracidiphilus sp.]
MAQVPEVLGADIGQFVVLAVRPDVLHRIQLWRVGRQILRLQPALLVADELLGEQTAVAWEPVPNQ